MAVDKPTISMDAELREQADRLARAEGVSFSAFVSNAVSDAVDRRRASKALLAAVADWEGEHGVITDTELKTAANELGLVLPEKPSVRRRGNTPTRVMGVKAGRTPTQPKRLTRGAAANAVSQSPRTKSKKK